MMQVVYGLNSSDKGFGPMAQQLKADGDVVTNFKAGLSFPYCFLVLEKVWARASVELWGEEGREQKKAKLEVSRPLPSSSSCAASSLATAALLSSSSSSSSSSAAAAVSRPASPPASSSSSFSSSSAKPSSTVLQVSQSASH